VGGIGKRTIKVERVNRTTYPTREHPRIDITRYIELRDNQKRLHSALGYRIPNEEEARLVWRERRSAHNPTTTVRNLAGCSLL
jgi:putative transposase